MTTVQEPLKGHRVFPHPCSLENPSEANRADLPPNKVNHGSASAPAACDVQPSAANDDPVVDENVLPYRCQFTFSDGRQCRMARSEIHPSRCRFHAEREEQLFGDPAPGGNVVGAVPDLPELHSACRDLTTATGVNRALAQVFRLLAQRRISRQEAATFGHLAQLLLRTISLMRQENLTSRPGSSSSAAKVYPQDELSPVNSSRERHGDQELSRVNKAPIQSGLASRENSVNAGSLSDQSEASSPRMPSRVTSQEHSPQGTNGASGPHPASASLHPSAPIAPAAPSEPLAECTARKSSPGMNTGADVVRNSSEMSTSKIAGLKLTQNEHLQKNGGAPLGRAKVYQQDELLRVNKVGHRRERHGHQELRGINKVSGGPTKLSNP
ncbi:MAG: hypothetical protein DMG32_06380 [Acidobacteria bacterium]|nr:MAG: hypothetical protein DMG32_06380 [Acidobacteriota bacterium]